MHFRGFRGGPKKLQGVPETFPEGTRRSEERTRESRDLIVVSWGPGGVDLLITDGAPGALEA